MSGLGATLEIDRIKNLISNFGWEILKQEIKDNDIILKIQRVCPQILEKEVVGGSK